jgi:hypothetical protein
VGRSSPTAETASLDALMAVQHELRGGTDRPDDPDDEASGPQPPNLGGGLLGLVREEVTALRTSAAVERAALIDSVASKLTAIEQQLSELRADVASARAESEAAQVASAGSVAAVHAEVEELARVDVDALVQQAVAAQVNGIVEAVVAALRPQIAELANAIPVHEIEQTSAELSFLRTALLGSSD